MTLRVEAFYEANQLPAQCAICGRSTGGRFSPPVRFVLVDGENQIGDVCERCAYGSVDLWRLALIEYAVRLETRAAILRSLAMRVDGAEPIEEGVAEDIIRENAGRQSGRPGLFPPGPFGR